MKRLMMIGVIGAMALNVGCSGSNSDSDSSSDNDVELSASSTSLPEQMELVGASEDDNSSGASMRALHDVTGFASTSDYATHRQNEYVFLNAVQPITFIDSLLCFTNQSQPVAMLGEGDYISWNDAEACFEENGSDGAQQNQGGEEVQNFVTIVGNSSQASTSEPLIYRGWVEDYAGQSGEEYGPTSILMLGEISKTPTQSNPFGEFTLTYGLLPSIDTAGSVTGTNDGYGEVTSSVTTDGSSSFTLYQFEKFQENGQDIECSVTASVDYNESTQAGLARTGTNCVLADTNAGVQDVNEAYALAVNEDYVHMASGTSYDEIDAGNYTDTCLDRNQYTEVAWSYSLFNKSDGSEVEINSGQQLKVDTDSDTSNGYEGWGHIGYWGSWREDGEEFTDGETVQAATYDDTEGETFTVKVAPGRLIKNTVDSINLEDLDGITFARWLFEDDGHLLNANTDINGDADTDDEFLVVFQANSTNDGFEIVATKEWTENGPEITTLQAAVPITLATDVQLDMWSDQLGGSVRYKEGSSKITIFARSYVDGSETDTGELFANSATSVTLECFGQCLDVNLASTDIGISANYDDVYVGNDPSSLQNYTFAQSDLTLKINTDSVKFADAVTASDMESAPFWFWGANSGPMVTSTVATAASINSAATLNSAIDDGTVTVFYEWTTGIEPWQQNTVLVDSSNATVSFDRPITIKYTHETGNDRNSSATQDGMVYLLEYGGRGQLWGLPWSQDGDNYYPQISLNDATIMGSSDQYIIKANEVEQKMTSVDQSLCSDLALTAPSQALPTDITQNVFNIGTMPDISDEPPSLIDGELVTE